MRAHVAAANWVYKQGKLSYPLISLMITYTGGENWVNKAGNS